MLKIEKVENKVWKPIRTKPRSEKKLLEWCDRNEIVMYLPLLKSVKRYERSTATHYKPMFPGYTFACIDDDDYSVMVLCHKVLFQIDLTDSDEEILIGELNAIQILESQSEEKEIEVKPELKEGASVTVISGPMIGLTGIVERRKGKNIVHINVEMLGQSVATEIDIGDVQKN